MKVRFTGDTAQTFPGLGLAAFEPGEERKVDADIALILERSPYIEIVKTRKKKTEESEDILFDND